MPSSPVIAVEPVERPPSRPPPTVMPATAQALVAGWPGAVIVYDRGGAIVAANGAGARLAASLGGPGGSLTALVRRAAEGTSSIVERLDVGTASGRQWHLCTAMPLDSGVVCVLARDESYDVNIRNALVDSRQRYRDLVTISSDFAWETGEDGRFVFVSPHGALGFSADELVGRHPRELLIDPADPAGLRPFAADEPVENAQVWVLDSAGAEACLLASAMPVRDRDGGWCGARGLARDVTRERLRDSELARAKVREQVVAYIVRQIREEARPQAMLAAAVSMLGRATSSVAAVFETSDGVDWREAARHGGWPPGFDPPTVARALATGDGRIAVRTGAWNLLARSTRYHGTINGALALVRSRAAGPWGEDDEALLEAVGGQMAIALRQIADQRELERLSSTDGLTGLLNRRALADQLVASLDRAERNRQQGVLLYVDLDHFKPVNDNYGHEVGDNVLRELAHVLKVRSRSYDLVARIGGDEFVLWLDGAALAEGERRAEDITQTVAGLRERAPNPAKPLGASVGVAAWEPDTGEDMRHLLARADAAMYQAKARGKSGWAVAESAAAASSSGGEAVA
ncbi:MAG: diguanylate cyclase [Alphaproteobacteria bacterium]